MELTGVDRLRYFVPTAICIYLAALCAVLIVTSAFIVSLSNAVAVTVAGSFGLSMSGGLGLIFWHAQRRDLQFSRITTSSDAQSNFEAVRSAADRAGWRLLVLDPGRRLVAQTSGVLLDVGERVAVQFRDRDVLVASICDPSIGFSLAGRRHCADHREFVRQVVLPKPC
jgi:regulator of protease activity HflC (stomatin/prohibitin superfamily)